LRIKNGTTVNIPVMEVFVVGFCEIVPRWTEEDAHLQAPGRSAPGKLPQLRFPKAQKTRQLERLIRGFSPTSFTGWLFDRLGSPMYCSGGERT
jgi:hypothetical protein